MQKNNETELLAQLANDVEAATKQHKKLHEVWQLSFDWKDCRSNKFCWQKLDYMHNNPSIGKWILSANPIAYAHSFAKFYLTGVQGVYPVINFMEMEDIYFNKIE